MGEKAPTGRGGNGSGLHPFSRQANEYRRLLERVGWTQVEAGRRLGFSPRASRRYASGEAEIPESANILLRLLARNVISDEQMRSAGRRGRT